MPEDLAADVVVQAASELEVAVEVRDRRLEGFFGELSAKIRRCSWMCPRQLRVLST